MGRPKVAKFTDTMPAAVNAMEDWINNTADVGRILGIHTVVEPPQSPGYRPEMAVIVVYDPDYDEPGLADIKKAAKRYRADPVDHRDRPQSHEKLQALLDLIDEV